MKFLKLSILLPAVVAVAACGTNIDKTVDRGIDSKHLSQRLDPYGKPVCSGTAPPNTATGAFKSGSPVPDPI